MKRIKIFILLISYLLLFSCKKTCLDNNKINLTGKVKSIKQYNLGSTDTVRFYLFYDSLTGKLDMVKNDSLTLYYIEELDVNNILFYDNEMGQTYKINVSNFQINTISKLNSIITNVILDNNKLDSIHDEGDFYNYNINYYNFVYKNDNWESYSVNYMYNFFGTSGFKQYDTRLVYNNTLNNGYNMGQTIGTLVAFPDVSTNFPTLTYFLGLNGYYIFKPSKYLLDSVVTNESSNTYIKYNYEFQQDKISRIVFKSQNSIIHNDYKYY